MGANTPSITRVCYNKKGREMGLRLNLSGEERSTDERWYNDDSSEKII
jgi:hypothetical protein